MATLAAAHSQASLADALATVTPGPDPANRAHAKLRAPGERANAQLKDLAHPPQAPLLPLARRTLAEAIHVLQIREANAGRKGLTVVLGTGG